MTTMATDPVCGMQVSPEVALAQGLVAEHDGQTHYFCSRGCLLDFQDDPQKVLDPNYEQHM